MATAGDALNVLRLRTRDPNATALSDSDGLTLLTWAQRYLNVIFTYETNTADVTVPESVRFVPVTNIANNVARPLHVACEGRQLMRVSWHALHSTSSTALGSDRAPRPLVWAPYGHTFFAFAPAVARTITLTVQYATVPATIASTGTTLIVPDRHLNMLYDLCEALLYIRLRQLAYVKEPFTRFMAFAQVQLGSSAATTKAGVLPEGTP